MMTTSSNRAYLEEEIMIKEEPTDISESLQIKVETSSADAEIMQKPQETKQKLHETEQELEDTEQELQETKQELQETEQELENTEQELQETRQELQETEQEPKDTKQELEETKQELEDTKQKLEDNAGTDTDSADKNEGFSRISAHPDFLCVAQFIGTFGGLLGIPQFFIDTIEDGLNSSNTDIDSDEYVKACGTAVEQLIISLLKRIGVVTNIPKLSATLQTYLEKKNFHIHTTLSNSVFNDLPKVWKLQILKLICLSQFDENCRFKTELNSQYSPDDLRFLPLGRDLVGSQYWFISDREKSHRLYRWKYPYTQNSWSLLSATFSELQRVLSKLRPPESDHELRQSKLWEIVNTESVIIPPENTEKKKAKKKKKKKDITEKEIKVEDLEQNIRKYELGMRKSTRNVNRKVYTEINEDNETSEEEDEEEEHDEKYKEAVEVARSRKRSRKHLHTPRNKSQGEVMLSKQKIGENVQQQEKEELVDSFINFKKNENTNSVSKDPFAFLDKETNRRHSDSHGSQYKGRNGRDHETELNRKHFVRKPTQQLSSVRQEFIDSIRDIPSLFEIIKPAEAQDKCWKCKGEENVDKMLFCDGCDLATYHMACLLPPIETVPDDDWLCPVCEQVLLFLKLRINLDKLKIYTLVPHASRSRARKSHPLPRTNTCRIRTVQRSFPRSTPSPSLSVNHARSTPSTSRSVNRAIPYRPPLITPSRSVEYKLVTARPRAKIGKIDRLSEAAKRVFDHYEEDTRSPLEHRVKTYKGGPYYGRSQYGENNYLEDSESDCEVMYPDEIESDSSSESEFSHRPSRRKPLIGTTPPGLMLTAEKKYTADDFLAEPPRSSEVKMGYNPLGASRSLCRPSNPPHNTHGSRDTAGIVNNPTRCSTPNRESTCDSTRKNRHIIRNHGNQSFAQRQIVRNHDGNQKISSGRSKYVDTATAIAEGRIVSENRERVEDSRSGNVVMPNKALSKEQQQALATWEEDNKRRKDTFDFDD